MVFAWGPQHACDPGRPGPSRTCHPSKAVASYRTPRMPAGPASGIQEDHSRGRLWSKKRQSQPGAGVLKQMQSQRGAAVLHKKKAITAGGGCATYLGRGRGEDPHPGRLPDYKARGKTALSAALALGTGRGGKISVCGGTLWHCFSLATAPALGGRGELWSAGYFPALARPESGGIRRTPKRLRRRKNPLPDPLPDYRARGKTLMWRAGDRWNRRRQVHRLTRPAGLVRILGAAGPNPNQSPVPIGS